MRIRAQAAWPCGGELAKYLFAPLASGQLVLLFFIVHFFLGFVVVVQRFGRYLPPGCSHNTLALHSHHSGEPPSNFGSLLPAAWLAALLQFWAQFDCAGTGADTLTRWARVLAW
mgnify:CR=1 FL=1